MRINFKKYVLATSLMVTPMKSVNSPIMKSGIVDNCVKSEYLAKTVDAVQKERSNVAEFIDNKMVQLREINARRGLNFIDMTKPHTDLDVSKTKFSGHPEFLNMFLKGVLKGKGKQFINAQEKYGINATFLIGVANHESAYGTSDFALNRNNIAGMRNGHGYMYFNSVDDCIDKMASNLKRMYIDQGLTTISQINKKYAEDTQWGNHVVGRMSPIYRASVCRIYKFN